MSFKIVLLGESQVGKTSMLLRFIEDVFNEGEASTIGASYSAKTVQLNPETEVKLDIWDTAGQEVYRSISHLYYKDALGVFVVFDVQNEHSFNECMYWCDQVKIRASNPDIVVIIIGNKVDLHPRDVPAENGEKMARSCQANAYMEISAKTGVGVVKAFEEMARLCHEIRSNAPLERMETLELQELDKILHDDSQQGCCK